MSSLELNAVCKSFGSLPAVDNVSLSVPKGSRTAIVGPSGSGKTTLLRMIAGFEFPDSGSITLNGTPLVDGPTEVPAHQRLIGYVPQDGALFPHMTIAANIGFGLPGNAASKQQRIHELMDMVALDTRMLQSWPHELSGGQQQRVALARALAQRPKLMLLDEPFSALDTGLRASMRKAVAKLLSDAGVTTILVTHDQAEALSFANQLAVMRHGKLIQVGPPMDLYLRPRDEETAYFLGDAVVLPAMIEGGWATCELGRIPVSDGAFRGTEHIMLRPEQIELSAAPASGEECLGVVTDSDFGGNACLLTVQLKTASPARALLVRSSSIHAPMVGSTVGIRVIGRGHVLDNAL
ncbi:ABC transporter ATP-binding protein [Pseudomonas sp. 10B1]|uniref:ABC transporter ATP-binding protein n=1 Tax=unclassified Pseudomonas TaxID=196821 RepID=UPI002AB4AFAB|nr:MULTISPECIES: ABC transporter ATP-binding protein [unclassified Pseudomonas]MDY7562271.1 ABC transporter ATP-binding protein [Pseudomonas sp. AB6]MEA9976305.1 ABC transporter ATP-binding protein [Pseudomonas sp. RTS4]MEA9994806.1 ABC transporter ATP-binding protein [Pseudomonas sp. AA4]MEB0086469.1 ABC transporter ATP-binding protein [Pseudomonas sp. RTI1]MEB0126332.1 ABC transporter ATP-binding protein [Pseudomonas sp. CCC1.2]